MKIALVQTPCWGIICPAYGLAVLATYLERPGHEVYIKNLNIEFFRERKAEYADLWKPEHHLFWTNPSLVSGFIFAHSELIDEKINQILDSEAQIIGFSIHFTSEHMAKEIARRIKQKDKKRVIVFGGPQARRANSGLELAELEYIDFVVQGEGEITFAEIIKKTAQNENINFCQGSIFKQNGKIIDGGDRPVIPDLNSLPFAGFQGFDFALYLEPSRVPISFSRGTLCPCIFTNEKSDWQKFRSRRADDVFSEIKYHKKKIWPLGYPFLLAIDYLDFHDSLLNGNISELEKFCNFIIKDKLEIKWGGQVAVSRVMTNDLLMKMRKSGCVCLDYGLEIGLPKLMRRIGRLLAKDGDTEQIVRDTHNAGIDCRLNFMFGFPNETEEDFQETLEFLDRNSKFIDLINPSPGFRIFEKGSYAYEHPGEFGVILGESGVFWESQDGINNYAWRLEKFEGILEKANQLGINNFYPNSRVMGRDMVLGHYYFIKKVLDKAIWHLNEAVKQYPQDESSWIYFAKSAFCLGDISKAQACFEQVAKIKMARMDFAGAQEVKAEAKQVGIVI